MASGLPDFQRGVDIAAQSLANLNVDLVAQTLSNLNVDIIAQTIANLDIDVNAQSLAQLTNRPKYGASESVLGVVQVAASTETDLVEVTGKGMIYGGVVHLTAAASQKHGIPHLYIDGEDISTLSFYTQNIYQVTKGYSNPFSLLTYDEVKFRYAAAINYGFTFETGFKVTYEEDAGDTPYVVCRAAFALI